MAARCYNKGCGQEFNPDENKDDACQHHPGQPVFHDALKGWSCCKRRSTDFTEFLNITGCTRGKHSSEKPVEADKPKETLAVIPDVVVAAPRKPIVTTEEVRPDDSEPLQPLPISIGTSLQNALLKQLQISDNEKDDAASDGDKLKGTSCKNHACNKVYEDESSDLDGCVYHSGVPVFHEGMKYWSCCQRKTTDFDNFLNQEGCTTGVHSWIMSQDAKKVTTCRLDWHQTGTHVIMSVFAKMCVPQKTTIEANRVTVAMNIVFDQGNSFFKKTLVLKGVIDPAKSCINMLGSKVEISLKKAQPGSWSALEYPNTK